MIQELVAAGADPLIPDNAGNLPGSYARSRKAVKLFQKLEAAKADEYRAAAKNL